MPNQVSIFCPKCGFKRPYFSFLSIRSNGEDFIAVRVICPDCNYEEQDGCLDSSGTLELISWLLSQTSYTSLLKMYGRSVNPVFLWGSCCFDSLSWAKKLLPCLDQKGDIPSWMFLWQLELQDLISELVAQDLFGLAPISFPDGFFHLVGGGDAMDSLAESHISRRH